MGASAPREGYNNPPISGENLIGLSRARRLHNAIFVNFEGDEVPEQPMEAAVQTWRRICTNPMDRKVEEELRKVSPAPPPALPPGDPAGLSSLLAAGGAHLFNWFISTRHVLISRRQSESLAKCQPGRHGGNI